MVSITFRNVEVHVEGDDVTLSFESPVFTVERLVESLDDFNITPLQKDEIVDKVYELSTMNALMEKRVR